MTQIDTSKADNISLPLPPERQDAGEMAVYARFMQHLRHVPNSRMSIKVLSAIQFTADMQDHSDAHVAKLLVDLGLRAPRMAFPADFLTFIDQALMRDEWDVAGPSEALCDLRQYWNENGEDRFVAFKRDYPRVSEDAALV